MVGEGGFRNHKGGERSHSQRQWIDKWWMMAAALRRASPCTRAAPPPAHEPPGPSPVAPAPVAPAPVAPAPVAPAPVAPAPAAPAPGLRAASTSASSSGVLTWATVRSSARSRERSSRRPEACSWGLTEQEPTGHWRRAPVGGSSRGEGGLEGREVQREFDLAAGGSGPGNASSHLCRARLRPWLRNVRPWRA